MKAPAAPPKASAHFWPRLAVGLLVIHALGWVAFAVVAANDVAFAVEPDYYRKSLDWDSLAAQAQTNRALGWTLRLDIDEGGLRCRVSDPDGNAVVGARTTAEAFAHARAATSRAQVSFTEDSPGLYVSRFPFDRAGLWEFRFTVRRDDTLFTHVVTHEVPGPSL